MSIGSNAYFNNPAFAQAASNLMGLFAPPSGSDAAGWATANAKREEAARLKAFYDYATSPGFSQQTFDRMGIGAGVYAPNQSYYSVDQGNATSRANNAADNARALQDRKIQEDAALQRLYITDATSRANNAADNTRALATNAADNTRAVETNRLTELGKLFSPLNQGQIRPAMPADIAGQFVGANRALPTEQGLQKPLTETEFNAAVLGTLPPNEQRAAALGTTPVTNIATPAGPRIAFQADAVGAEPFINKGAEAKPTNAVALMPDGKTRVPARQDPDGRWVHAQTGQPLPDGIQIFGLPQATGSAADVGLGPTTANQTQGNNQEAEITRALSLLDIYEGAVRNNPGALGLAGLIRGTAQNAVATANDLAASFGKSAPEVAAVAQEVRAGMQGVAPEFFDPAIPEIDFLQGTLAYSLARTENPSGEVSRQAFERALERVKGGGLLANQNSALSAITANRKVLETQLQGLKVLRAPGTGRTDTAYQPTDETVGAPVERWIRGPDGRPVRAQ